MHLLQRLALKCEGEISLGTFVAWQENLTVGQSKLRNGELHSLYPSPNTGTKVAQSVQ